MGLHKASARWPALLLIALTATCSKDFSSFHFSAGGPTRIPDPTPEQAGATDAGTPHDAGNSADPDGNTGMDAALAHTPPTQKIPDAAPPLDAAPDSQPPTAADSGMPNRSEDEDAQVPTETLQCYQDVSVARISSAACQSCACDRCAGPTLDCLSRGSAPARAACAQLFRCALEHHCHDWDCYCTSMRCFSSNEAPPDGPCAAEMNAAAGGGHEQVSAVHRANDPDQPLVRAVRAIGCTTGVPRGSVGGAMTGKCTSTCAP